MGRWPADRLNSVFTGLFGLTWYSFDPAAAPYTPSQAEIDRLRRPYVN